MPDFESLWEEKHMKTNQFAGLSRVIPHVGAHQGSHATTRFLEGFLEGSLTASASWKDS